MAYQFNGSNQYLSTASAPATAAPLTLACMARPSVTGTSAYLAIGNTTTGDRFQIALNIAGVGVAAQTIASGINNTATVGALPPTNSWLHAAGVFSASNNRVAYLDGVAGTANTSSSTPSGINSLYVGARNTGGSIALYFNGAIAEVGVWSAALNADEILSLSRGATCDKVRPQSLVFYAPLVRNLQDVRGGLTITNNNTATVAAHTRVYA
jgi:hypothetical protein